MVDGFAKTPRYVLRDGSLPATVRILPDGNQSDERIIYGFSDKPEYDRFLKSSAGSLTPYPLVKGYLQNQIALASDSDARAVTLIVLDAESDHLQTLNAATLETVLASIEGKSSSVAISHRLTFNEASQSYRVEVINVADAVRLGQ